MENISPGQIIDEPIRPVNIPRKEKDFQGMLEYKKEDEQKLVKNLILGKCFLFFSQFCRLGSPRSRCQLTCFLVRPLCLACQQLSSGHPHRDRRDNGRGGAGGVVQGAGERQEGERERELSSTQVFWAWDKRSF